MGSTEVSVLVGHGGCGGCKEGVGGTERVLVGQGGCM
jgi:hypothetical protein